MRHFGVQYASFWCLIYGILPGNMWQIRHQYAINCIQREGLRGCDVLILDAGSVFFRHFRL